MSASPYGHLKAEIHGFPFTFDGLAWTYPELPPEWKEFFDVAVHDLNSDYVKRDIYLHTTLKERAQIMLRHALSGDENWQIIESMPDPDWHKNFPDDAID